MTGSRHLCGKSGRGVMLFIIAGMTGTRYTPFTIIGFEMIRLGVRHEVFAVDFIPEEIHVLAKRLAIYVSSDSPSAKVTSQ